MKTNLSTYFFVICYFLTSNWTISDYYVTPSSKNLVLGLFLFLILAIRINYRKINFNIYAFLFSIIGLVSVLANSLTYLSLFFQCLFLFIFSLYIFDKKEIISVIKKINKITYLFLFITIFQIILIFFNQDLLIYATPTTSTGLSLDQSAEIGHWIQLLGNMTDERFNFLGKQIPRFCGFLSEPSSVPNLIFLPKILEILYKRKISFYDIMFFVLSLIIYRSGFVTLYLFFALLVVFLSNFKKFYTKIVPYSIFPVSLLIFIFLRDIAITFLEYSQLYEVYSLTNKENTVTTRVLGFEDMLNNISLFGNHDTAIYGVGLLIHYSILYGIFGGIFTILFIINIFQKKYFFVFYLMVFTLLFLSKGFSALFILIILLCYVQKTSTSN